MAYLHDIFTALPAAAARFPLAASEIRSVHQKQCVPPSNTRLESLSRFPPV
jgi:hypothetical protein